MTAGPPVWVLELAGRFWAEAGESTHFPRDLRAAACCFLDLQVHEVPGLTLARAAERLRTVGVPCASPAADRPLHGLFGSFCGRGHILLDPGDAPDQLRFTFAHELAHFLRDCREARRRAAARFGPNILAVLDGRRPPTPTERLSGALRGVPVGPHTHFLERDRWGHAADEGAHEAEEAADRLAFELLAPFDAATPGPRESRPALAARLAAGFGLPPGAAAKYAALLLR